MNLRADFLIFSVSPETSASEKYLPLAGESPFTDDDYITLFPLVVARGEGLGERTGGRLGLADVNFNV